MFQLECKLINPLIYCLSKLSNEISCEITDDGCTFSACDEGRTVYAVCNISSNILVVINDIPVKSFTVNSMSFYQVIQHFDCMFLEIDVDFINFKNMAKDTVFSLPQIQAEKLHLEYRKLNLSGYAKILPHLNWSLLLNSPFLHVKTTEDEILLSTTLDSMETKITINPHDCDAFESTNLSCIVPMHIITQIMQLGSITKKPVSWYYQSQNPMVLSLDVNDLFDFDVVVSISEQDIETVTQRGSSGDYANSTTNESAEVERLSNTAAVGPRPLKRIKYQ
eukprot:NODE_36_length_31474_cov_0.342438.p14 type:complete len:279 gc:universal NODE_36_length_31474_cov_0.342438:3893-4729(+)